jgi:hypothetical protein
MRLRSDETDLFDLGSKRLPLFGSSTSCAARSRRGRRRRSSLGSHRLVEVLGERRDLLLLLGPVKTTRPAESDSVLRSKKSRVAARHNPRALHELGAASHDGRGGARERVKLWGWLVVVVGLPGGKRPFLSCRPSTTGSKIASHSCSLLSLNRQRRTRRSLVHPVLLFHARRQTLQSRSGPCRRRRPRRSPSTHLAWSS